MRLIKQSLRAALLALVVLTMTSTANAGTGIDEQMAQLRALVRGKRVGMLTNPSGTGEDLRQTADILCEDGDTTITAFFAPEHGLRGDQQAGVKISDYTDAVTGIKVYSMYGAQKAPSDEQLSNIDVMVFDIQDVGVRFYTFSWSMTYAMEACARNGKPFIVLDRPNPVGLDVVEGNPNTQDYGIVGRKWEGAPFGVATRSGLTLGELARLVNGEWMNPKVALTVIPVPGLKRTTIWEETGRPWVIPSPNMPSLTTARLYPGTCVFEGTNLSEGRGTTLPFEQIGAPFIDGTKLAAVMNAKKLPGVQFRAAWFTPTFSKHKDVRCGGVQIHITDAGKLQPIRTALELLQATYQLYPEQTEIKEWAGKMMGDATLPEAIKSKNVSDIIKGWEPLQKRYLDVRKKYLIYK